MNPALENPLAIYDRGFLGSRKNGTQIADQRSKPLTLLSLFNMRQEDTRSVIVNEEVLTAFDQLRRRDVPTTDFDYRERVIKIFLQAFGSVTPAQWLYANLQSPTFSHRHASFIDDTFSFIMGKDRSIPVQSWDRMITADVNNPHDLTKLANSTLDYFDAYVPEHLANIRANYRCWTGICQQWLGRPGGFNDMVYSLNIMFGDDNNT